MSTHIGRNWPTQVNSNTLVRLIGRTHNIFVVLPKGEFQQSVRELHGRTWHGMTSRNAAQETSAQVSAKNRAFAD